MLQGLLDGWLKLDFAVEFNQCYRPEYTSRPDYTLCHIIPLYKNQGYLNLLRVRFRVNLISLKRIKPQYIERNKKIISTNVVDVSETRLLLRHCVVLPVEVGASDTVGQDWNIDIRIINWIAASLQNQHASVFVFRQTTGKHCSRGTSSNFICGATATTASSFQQMR